MFSIRLHHWKGSDDSRAPHDHPWDNWWTFVIWGHYIDHLFYDYKLGNTEILRKPGDFIRRRWNTTHWVELLGDSCWTITITGRQSRKWGFWVNGKFKKANKYFLTYGEHPCE